MAVEMSGINETLNPNALKLSQDWLPTDYDKKVDESILNIKFKPDIFQRQAFYFLSLNKPVFVSAHTSSGKTLVAEYAIFRAQQWGNRVIYTSPIKALSNQKFFDFKKKFADVGLITGDVQVNPEAQCLIMTTEILRNLVYKNSDILRNTEYVVFDEVHYINDPDRGVVWEEAIIMLPRHITLVMLSATIPNAMEFSEWVGRTKEQCVYVISTSKRAVPLEFAVYCDSEAYLLTANSNQSQLPGSNFKTNLMLYTNKIKPKNRFRISDLGNFIANRRLIPAIFFSFSRRVCEEYGKSLQSLDLNNPAEKKKVRLFLDEALSRISAADQFLPQIVAMKEQVARGVAVHHGGLLPFVKECIEILFSQNLIKILVATETFAMGVNMPAKCCVFLSITKIDGGSYRYLTNGEFIQMSGRAGRRGMDKTGTVILADQRPNPIESIKKMAFGIPSDLNSRFKLSFSLILMAMRSNIEVEELMRRSFREHGVQKSVDMDMARLAKLEKTEKLECAKCSDTKEFLKDLKFICDENYILIKKVVKEGDYIILKNNAIAQVTKIGFNRVWVEEAFDLINPNKLLLFSRPLEKSTDIGYTESLYIKYLPMRYSKTIQSREIPYEHIFAIIKNGDISFDYNLMDIADVDKIIHIKEAYERLINCKCLLCDEFDTHYVKAIETFENEKMAKSIINKYDRESLVHMTEYSSRIKFLKARGFIEDSIILKGRIAAEIRTVNEVLVTELILENKFKDFNSAELMAVFSVMMHEGNTGDLYDDEIEFIDNLTDKMNMITEKFEDLAKEMAELGIPPMEPLNYGMANAVHDWCKGSSLGAVVSAHGVQEGTFVRLILRLEEGCREMVNACTLMGDSELEIKFNEASECIKKDIVFMPSLYI